VDQTALERLLCAGQIAVNDLLKQTLFEELDEILMLLKRCRPIDEVRAGLMERLALAPLGEFNALKVMYFRHFDAREH
jgi:hypothetical protein